MRSIANLLNSEKLPAPDNLPRSNRNGWSNVTVCSILRHRAYIGIAELGKRKPTAKEVFARRPPKEKPGACPVLVDEATFDQAQRLLDANKEKKARQQPGRAGLLSGFLPCGKCGFRLTKEQRDGRVAYVCGSHARRPHLGCCQWRVAEADILPRIVAKVIEEVDQQVLGALDSRPREGQAPDRSDILTRRVETLKGKVATASRRCLTEEDDDLSREFREEVKRLKGELHEAEAALRLARTVQNSGGAESFAAWWGNQKAGLILFARRLPAECVPGRGQQQPAFIQVKPDPAAEAEPAGDITYYDDVPVFDKDGFRGLLARLGVQVKVHWKEATRKVGNRRFEVDFANIKIDLTWQGDKTSAKQEVKGHNGTC